MTPQPFVSIEPLKHAPHTALRQRMLSCHPPIVSPSIDLVSQTFASDVGTSQLLMIKVSSPAPQDGLIGTRRCIDYGSSQWHE
jgi:hypothetical protein